MEYEVYGDRDELGRILICKKHSLAGALGAAADVAEFWDFMLVYKGDDRVAIISTEKGSCIKLAGSKHE